MQTTEREGHEEEEAGLGLAESGDERVAGGDGEDNGKGMDEVQRFGRGPVSAHDSDRAYFLRMRSFPLTHGLNAFIPEV